MQLGIVTVSTFSGDTGFELYLLARRYTNLGTHIVVRVCQRRVVTGFCLVRVSGVSGSGLFCFD